jgi:hypothetical protein
MLLIPFIIYKKQVLYGKNDINEIAIPSSSPFRCPLLKRRCV